LRSGRDNVTEPRRIAIAEVTAPQGLRGEVRAIPLTDFPERFLHLKQVLVDGRPVAVESARFHKRFVLIKLAGCDNMSEAEKYRGKLLEVVRDELVPLPEGKYYFFQIIGLKVFTEEGEPVGEVTDVQRSGGQDLYVIRPVAGQGQHLIPAAKEIVRQIDLDTGKMVIRPIPGLLD
jgi:16S rRNA processing protein RimM